VGNAEITRRLGTCEDTARKWRRRYCRKGAEGLADLPRAGRPWVFQAAVVAQVKALACELPAASEGSLARWSWPARPPAGWTRRRRRPRSAAGSRPIDDHVIPSAPRRPGRPKKLSDAELVCLAVAQVLLGARSEHHWLRLC
jgi:hypothetical protein